MKVYRLDWTEYERGWGQRPDGYQLCASLKLAQEEIEHHIQAEKKHNPGGEVPDCYSAPGEPHEVEVDRETWKKVHTEGVVWG